MNISVYLFGDFGHGFIQYPNDYSKTIFETFRHNAQATTQIAIHRDEDLMYYGYLRMLENDKYIGLCTVVNGKVITDIDSLFTVYERAIETMVRNGYLIHFDDKGEITAKIDILYENKEEIDLITSILQESFNRLESSSRPLPAVNYSIGSNSVASFSIQDNGEDIIKSSYSYGYTMVYKSKGFNTAQMNSYKGIIARKFHEIEELQNECNQLKGEVSSLKNKQRNIKWVALLGIVAIVFGLILWNKVLFPSEVTKKDMGEYVYYGPIKNGEPNGIGVAIYKEDDASGRLYYYGNFTSGKRIDDNAYLFYKNGSYFNGKMDEDCWKEGLLFSTNKEHFIGKFKDNKPFDGKWYEHKLVQTIKNGE